LRVVRVLSIAYVSDFTCIVMFIFRFRRPTPCSKRRILKLQRTQFEAVVLRRRWQVVHVTASKVGFQNP
jgi:hypothetical protein